MTFHPPTYLNDNEIGDILIKTGQEQNTYRISGSYGRNRCAQKPPYMYR